jgi:acyltransferase
MPNYRPSRKLPSDTGLSQTSASRISFKTEKSTSPAQIGEQRILSSVAPWLAQPPKQASIAVFNMKTLAHTDAGRRVWVDWLKAFGIICVVTGHVLEHKGVVSWIYSFHMPLFFLVAGVNFGDQRVLRGWWEFYRKRVKPLVISYFVYALLGSLFYLLVTRFSRTMQEPFWTAVFGRIRAVAYGSGSLVDGASGLFPVYLWFFPALILALLLMWVVIQISSWVKQLIAVGVFSLIGLLFAHQCLPWEVESGLCALPIVFLGQKFGRHELKFGFILERIPRGSAWVLLVFGLYFSQLGPKIDFRTGHWGDPLPAFAACAFTIGGLIIVARGLPALSLVKVISEASSVIFPLHVMVTWPSRSLQSRLGLTASEGLVADWIWPVATVVVAVGSLTLLSLFMRTRRARVQSNN